MSVRRNLCLLYDDLAKLTSLPKLIDLIKSAPIPELNRAEVLIPVWLLVQYEIEVFIEGLVV